MGYVWLIVSIAAITAHQLFMKEGTLIAGEASEDLSELADWLLKLVSNPYTLSAIFFVAVSIIAWAFAMSRLKLSYITPLYAAVPIVFIAIFSLLLFEEDITRLGWLGIVIICAGVFLVSMQRESSDSKA